MQKLVYLYFGHVAMLIIVDSTYRSIIIWYPSQTEAERVYVIAN